MPSDPSTKDLIAAARKHRPFCFRPQHCSQVPNKPEEWCSACLSNALADRLEEVEEERDRCKHGYIRAMTALRSFIRSTRRDLDWATAVLKDIAKHVDPEPEPSNPDREDDPWKLVEKWATRGGFTPAVLPALIDLRKRVERVIDESWERDRKLADRISRLEQGLPPVEM